MEQIIQDIIELGSLAGITALINIIVIDIIMSGDNAIIIGMATKDLPEKNRKKAIIIGIILATMFRIIFAFFTVFLLSIVGLQFAGGVLLIYVVWKFYKELRIGEQGAHKVKSNGESGFMYAIYTIIIADISMSLDNVLAVAGAAHDNMAALAIGLVFSIILMAIASNYIAKNLNKYPQIQWVGLLVILFVAIEMMINGTSEMSQKLHAPNIFPFAIFIIGSLFIVLHKKYVHPLNEEYIKKYLADNYLKVIILNLVFLLILLFLGDIVSTFIKSHYALMYSLLFIMLWIILEVFSLFIRKK